MSRGFGLRISQAFTVVLVLATLAVCGCGSDSAGRAPQQQVFAYRHDLYSGAVRFYTDDPGLEVRESTSPTALGLSLAFQKSIASVAAAQSMVDFRIPTGPTSTGRVVAFGPATGAVLLDHVVTLNGFGETVARMQVPPNLVDKLVSFAWLTSQAALDCARCAYEAYRAGSELNSAGNDKAGHCTFNCATTECCDTASVSAAVSLVKETCDAFVKYNVETSDIYILLCGDFWGALGDAIKSSAEAACEELKYYKSKFICDKGFNGWDNSDMAANACGRVFGADSRYTSMGYASCESACVDHSGRFCVAGSELECSSDRSSARTCEFSSELLADECWEWTAWRSCASGTACTSSSGCPLAPSECPGARDCTGRECGPDPVCGIKCGDCDQGYDCVDATGECQPAAAQETCTDGIKNQGESGVDCGGPCPACPATCKDNIQNQNEVRPDCGGPCTGLPGYCPYGPGSDGWYCGSPASGQDPSKLYYCAQGDWIDSKTKDCGAAGCLAAGECKDDSCNVPAICPNQICESNKGETCSNCIQDCHPAGPTGGNSSVGATTVHLSWNAVPCANRYRVKVCSDPDMTVCITCPGSASGTCELAPSDGTTISIDRSLLSGHATWFWQASSIGAPEASTSWGTWSAQWSFTAQPTADAGSGGSGAGGASGSGGSGTGGAGGADSGTCVSNCSTPGLICKSGEPNSQYICSEVSPGCLQLLGPMACDPSTTVCVPGTSGCQNCGNQGQPCCSYSTTCKVGSCTNGTCQAPTCPATKDCAGRVCGPDPVCGLSCGTCPSNQQCNNTTGQCMNMVCSPFSYFCQNGDRRFCASDGMSSSFVETCQFTCSGGNCQPQCTGDAQCAANEFCQSNTCQPTVCPKGQTFCSNGNTELWQCNANGSSATKLMTCAYGCAAGSCKPQCTDDSVCAPGQYCSNQACVTDICPQGQYFCSSISDSSLCNANGSGSSFAQTCQWGCNSGTGHCSTCPVACSGKCNGASDGCGGTCTGTCPANQICQNQACVGDPCLPDPCNGHGTCSAGTCTCQAKYSGQSCSTCAAGYGTDYPTCTPLCSVAGVENTFSTGGFGYSSLTKTPTGYAVAWEATSLMFATLDQNGALVGSPKTLFTGSNPTIANARNYIPARYGLTYSGSNFRCISESAMPEGNLIQLRGTGSTIGNDVTVAYNDNSHFGVVWTDDRSGQLRIYFNRIDAGQCQLAGADTVVSPFMASYPGIASGNGWGVVWRGGGGEIYLTRLDQWGVKLGDTQVGVAYNNAETPRVGYLSTNGTWAVLWTDQVGGKEDLYLQRVKASDGALVGAKIRVTSSDSYSRYERMVSTSSQLGIVWASSTGFRFVRVSDTGQILSPLLQLTGLYVGDVASDGTVFMTEYQMGKSRKVTCP